jgi:hypothetical protein
MKSDIRAGTICSALANVIHDDNFIKEAFPSITARLYPFGLHSQYIVHQGVIKNCQRISELQ